MNPSWLVSFVAKSTWQSGTPLWVPGLHDVPCTREDLDGPLLRGCEWRKVESGPGLNKNREGSVVSIFSLVEDPGNDIWQWLEPFIWGSHFRPVVSCHDTMGNLLHHSVALCLTWKMGINKYLLYRGGGGAASIHTRALHMPTTSLKKILSLSLLLQPTQPLILTLEEKLHTFDLKKIIGATEVWIVSLKF